MADVTLMKTPAETALVQADCGVAAAVDEISRRSGYTIESHRLELFGICRRCQASTPSR